MAQSKILTDDHFDSFEAFIRLECKKIDKLREIQEQSGAQELFLRNKFVGSNVGLYKMFLENITLDKRYRTTID